MEEFAKQEPEATLETVFESQVPMVSLEALAVPIAILSLDDGVVVYTNAQFKNLIQNCPVGKPLTGLLATESMRKKALQVIEERSQYVFVKKNSSNSLRVTVTRDLYSGSPHFFVCIERQFRSKQASETKVRPLESVALVRTEFVQRVSELLNDRNNQDSDQCLCCIDIDRFLIINEKFGFDAGDHVLNELCSVVKDLLPSNATIGRIGGNEFGLLLRETSIDEGLKICETIRQAVKDHQFEWKNEKISITVSIGIISIRKQLDDIDYALSSVDLALRAAQENGRDCVHNSAQNDTMMVNQSDNMHYALVIEDAIQNNKFQLYAQPIVSLSDPSKHNYYEILLRSYDPKVGEFISSQELINAAESLEITTKIDQWVCQNIFKLLNEKSANGIELPIISLNLSGHSIVNPAFEKHVRELIEKYNVRTDRVCFEITESVAVKSITRAQKFIHNMRELGFKFSLDDFGVGYCSFNYLQQLDVDHVKIDGSFVSEMLESTTQFAMVKAITDVARAMKIKTIAEYIETPEVIKALTVIGVDYGQGYIFGKPAPIQDLF